MAAEMAANIVASIAFKLIVICNKWLNVLFFAGQHCEICGKVKVFSNSKYNKLQWIASNANVFKSKAYHQDGHKV